VDYAALAAAPAWTPWLDDARLDAMPLPQRRALSAELLPALDAFTSRHEGASSALRLIAARTSAVDELTLRTKTRSSAVLRMGALLSSIAGRVYLGSRAEPSLLDAYRALRACERLSLPGLGAPGASALPVELPAPPSPLGPIEADRRAIEAMTPAWTGLISSPLDDEEAEKLHVPRGAATVWGSMERSPAAAAGLGPGDVLLGPPDRPFSHPGDSLPWSMLLKPGEPQRVLVRRGRDTVIVTITPRARSTPWSPSPAR
jgi:hypothetical protein